MSTPTLTLADFLLARFAEEERLARLAADTEPTLWDDIEKGGIPDLDVTMATVAVMNRWSPWMVLAECEAKRRTIGLHKPEDRGGGWGAPPDWKCGTCGGRTAHPNLGWQPWSETFPCPTLRALALPYSDHPEYRSEWRP